MRQRTPPTVFAFGLLTFSALLGSGLQPASAAAQGKRVAYLSSDTKNPFVAAIAKSMEKEAKAAGFSLTIINASFDSALQAQQINDAIAQKYDALAVQAVSAHALIPALTQAKQSGVPIVLVNNPIEPGHENLYVAYVGEDQTELGRSTARSLLEGAGERKSLKTAILAGTLSEATPQMRIDGFKEVVGKDPRVKIVATEDAKWNMAVSEQIAGQLFARFAAQGGLDAIFAMSDQMAQGIIQAAKGADVPLGRTDGKLLIVTSDCMKFGMANIRSGLQYSDETVIPTRTGRVAADVIAEFLDGKKVEQQHYLPVQPVTKQSINKFVEACTF